MEEFEEDALSMDIPHQEECVEVPRGNPPKVKKTPL
jgi:hypothetical protein